VGCHTLEDRECQDNGQFLIEVTSRGDDASMLRTRNCNNISTLMSETFIQSFTHLKDRPNADRALHILKKVASLVKPIMRKHGWVLPVLAEFFPDSPNLLGKGILGAGISSQLTPAIQDSVCSRQMQVKVGTNALNRREYGTTDPHPTPSCPRSRYIL